MRRIFTDKDRDNIANLIEKGVLTKEIAEIFNCGKSSICYIGRFMELAKANNIKTLEHIRPNHEPLYQWAVKKYGIKTLPKEEPKAELPKVEIVEQHTYNNDKILIDLLAQLVKTGQETNELLKKLL